MSPCKSMQMSPSLPCNQAPSQYCSNAISQLSMARQHYIATEASFNWLLCIQVKVHYCSGLCSFSALNINQLLPEYSTGYLRLIWQLCRLASNKKQVAEQLSSCGSPGGLCDRRWRLLKRKTAYNAALKAYTGIYDHQGLLPLLQRFS